MSESEREDIVARLRAENEELVDVTMRQAKVIQEYEQLTMYMAYVSRLAARNSIHQILHVVEATADKLPEEVTQRVAEEPVTLGLLTIHLAEVLRSVVHEGPRTSIVADLRKSVGWPGTTADEALDRYPAMGVDPTGDDSDDVLRMYDWMVNVGAFVPRYGACAHGAKTLVTCMLNSRKELGDRYGITEEMRPEHEEHMKAHHDMGEMAEAHGWDATFEYLGVDPRSSDDYGI